MPGILMLLALALGSGGGAPAKKNLRIWFMGSGIVDVEVSAIACDPNDLETYVEAIEVAVDAAAPDEAWSFNVTWYSNERRVVVDNSGDGRMLLVQGDPHSWWPALGFAQTTTFGILPAIGTQLPPPEDGALCH